MLPLGRVAFRLLCFPDTIARCIATKSGSRTRIAECRRRASLPPYLSLLRCLASGTSHGQDSKAQTKIEFVLLLDTDGRVLGTRTKEEALLFAKKLDLNLVRLEPHQHADAKKKPVYKLLTAQQLLMHDDEIRKGEEKEDKHKPIVKTVLANGNITDNDLEIKLRHIQKWLEKPCEIRVGIMGTPGSEKQLEALYQKFESSCEGRARFLQKRIKAGVLKFTIVPPSQKNAKHKGKPSGDGGGIG